MEFGISDKDISHRIFLFGILYIMVFKIVDLVFVNQQCGGGGGGVGHRSSRKIGTKCCTSSKAIDL